MWLARKLDATLVLQNYSRLVIDCNRPGTASDSIPAHTEWSRIEGNEHLSATAIAARTDGIFTPYHDGLRSILDRRLHNGRQTLLVAVHSFTPMFRGTARPWHIGVMYHRDARVAGELIKRLRRDERLIVGDNEPYSISDETDYTLPAHGESRGLAHVGIEIRQDLVADEAGQIAWAVRLAALFEPLATDVLADV